MKKIRVLEVIRQGEVGGGESHLIDLVTGIDRDIEPIILSFTSGNMIEVLRKNNIKCYVIKTSNKFNLFLHREIGKILKKEKIDIVHAHGTRAAFNMLISTYKTKIPLVYTVHGWSFHQDQSFLKKKIRIICEKNICKRSNKVICVSESNRELGINEFNLSNSIVIENGINLTVFNPILPSTIHDYFRINSDDFVVAFIGRITTQKSPIDFIDSIALAHHKNKKIKGLIVGEGDLLGKVKDYIIKNKYNEFIQLEKFRKDIPQVLKVIDLFVLPSLWEGLSIALLEAMAMKKAIVTTPTDGTRDIIIDGHNGIIVPFHSPQKLADVYLELFHEPSKRILLGENAFRMIHERFDSKLVCSKVSDIYKNILQCFLLFVYFTFLFF